MTEDWRRVSAAPARTNTLHSDFTRRIFLIQALQKALVLQQGTQVLLLGEPTFWIFIEIAEWETTALRAHGAPDSSDRYKAEAADHFYTFSVCCFSLANTTFISSLLRFYGNNTLLYASLMRLCSFSPIFLFSHLAPPSVLVQYVLPALHFSAWYRGECQYQGAVLCTLQCSLKASQETTSAFSQLYHPQAEG